MDASQKITVEIPQELLRKALAASGQGVTATVREGLRLVAAGSAYSNLRALRGKVRFSKPLAELRADRT